jgi:NDP-sugar pyrophosphorylase family protein
MDGRYVAPPFAGAAGGLAWVAPDARVEEGAELNGPCFVDEGAVIKAGARILPYTVLGRQTHVEEGAVVDGAIVWANTWIGREATVRRAVLGRNCHVGRSAVVSDGLVLGDKSVITDYSRV